MEDLRHQRIAAKALLDLLLIQERKGKATAEQVEIQTTIYQKILEASRKVVMFDNGYTILMPPADVKDEFRGLNAQRIYQKREDGSHYESDFSPEQMAELNSLKSELREIDLEKNRLINAMAKIKPTVNALAEVEAIAAKREEWVKKSDEIWYYRKHGQRIEEPKAVLVNDGAYLASLPRDRYLLEKARRNAMSNISKHKGKGDVAKEEAGKRHHETEQMKWQLKFDVIENLIGSI